MKISTNFLVIGLVLKLSLEKIAPTPSNHDFVLLYNTGAHSDQDQIFSS